VSIFFQQMFENSHKISHHQPKTMSRTLFIWQICRGTLSQKCTHKEDFWWAT